MSQTERFLVGVDIGGTFTDLIALSPSGRQINAKVPSTPPDFSQGVLDGLRRLFQGGVSPAGVTLVLHATTVATNAILEKKGAECALITTAGFQDVLELRRLRYPRLYDTTWEKPEPLVPRRRRLEVRERMDARGQVLVPMDADEVRQLAVTIRSLGVQSVAVCLLNAYINPAHEVKIGQILGEELPGVAVSLSYEIQREIKEYERTSTTVLNAYVRPVVQHYVASLEERLQEAGVRGHLFIMQSSGNLMTGAQAAHRPVYMIESGPAAGVIGARTLAHLTGYPNMITFDMGGTTAKASIIEDGELSISAEYEVGGGINVGNRLLKGGGYAMRVPSVDLAEVGAGGGSIAGVDAGGALQVGPVSAGAVPGPACYGMGGTEPTITDANVVLGYLNPRRLAGGTMNVVPELSARALDERVARPLGLDLQTAAYGVHVLAGATMSRAIQAVSVERGRDPRDFVMLAFGGSGPLHAAQMARSLGMKTVLVPPVAGLFSAFGLLFSDVGQQYVQTCMQRLEAASLPQLQAVLAELKAQAYADMASQGYATGDVELRLELDLRYLGQSSHLTVRCGGSDLAAADIPALIEAFGREHERTYGHRGTTTVEVANLRLWANARGGRFPFPMLQEGKGPGGAAEPLGERTAYFGADYGTLVTPLVTRAYIAEQGTVPGPLILEEYDCTIVVPPESTAAVDAWGNLVMHLQGVGGGAPTARGVS